MAGAFLSKQFLLFLCTGGFAAAVNFGSCIILNRYMDFSKAIVVAYLFGMFTAFTLNRAFVFSGRKNSTAKSAFYFAIVNVFAVLQTWVVSVFFAFVLLPGVGVDAFREEVAHFIGVIVPVFTSFVGHKKLSFK